MSLNDIVQLAITRVTKFPSRVGFGTPMVVACHSATPNMVDFYTDILGVAADHAVTSPVWRAANAMFSQNPPPAQIAIGKRLTAPTMVVTLAPLLTTAGLHYKFTIWDHLRVATAVDYIVPSSGSPTLTTIAAGIAALMTPFVGVTVAAASGVITCTSTTAGWYFDISGLPDLLQMAVKDTSADPGLTADLNAIAAVDTTTWYDFVLDHAGKAEILAAAAWTESTRHLFYGQSSDSEIADNAVTTDVASALVAAAYARTGIMFSQNELLDYRAAALEARMATIVPGASTWELQTLAGITVDRITAGSQIKIKAKFCAIYTAIGGLNKTQNVVVADHEFVDLIPGTDKLFADIQFNVYALISQASDAGQKIPYTDDGVTRIKGAVSGALTDAVNNGFLSGNPAPIVSAPKVATIPASTKASRVLPNVVFSGTLAGAIHEVQIVGTLGA